VPLRHRTYSSPSGSALWAGGGRRSRPKCRHDSRFKKCMGKPPWLLALEQRQQERCADQCAQVGCIASPHISRNCACAVAAARVAEDAGAGFLDLRSVAPSSRAMVRVPVVAVTRVPSAKRRRRHACTGSNKERHEVGTLDFQVTACRVGCSATCALELPVGAALACCAEGGIRWQRLPVAVMPTLSVSTSMQSESICVATVPAWLPTVSIAGW
jgi:hypothetical protein